MKRRNFLKTITGLCAVPATMCSAKSTQELSQKSSSCNAGSINHDNIKINGTFEGWVNSIAKEIERLLAVKSKEPDADWFGSEYSIKVVPGDWSPKQDGSMPALAVCISISEYKLGTHFSFTKYEWDRDHHPKSLQRRLDCRYVDCIWSMYDVIREQMILLKKLGIDCSKSLNEHGVI